MKPGYGLPIPAMLVALLWLGAALAADPGHLSLPFHPAADPAIRAHGRTAQGRDGTLWVDWSSVYFEFEVTGPAYVELEELSPHGNIYRASLGGEPTVPPALLNSSYTTNNRTVLLLNKDNVTRSVRIEKITESRADAGGLSGFRGVYTATLRPSPRPASPRRIECIGDSIMCGNHCERWSPFPDSCAQGRANWANGAESSYLSWCPVLARKLGAEYQVECMSGNGLVMSDGGRPGSCCDWQQFPNNCPMMPGLWTRRLACAFDGGCTDKSRVCSGYGGEQPLDISNPPQAMVINLGQNDYGKPPNRPTLEQWKAAYLAFAQNISSTYKQKPVFFLACGGMANKYCNDTIAAVGHLQSAGFKAEYLDITAGSAGHNETTMGCANHPSWIANAAAADIAEPIVRRVLQW